MEQYRVQINTAYFANAFTRPLAEDEIETELESRGIYADGDCWVAGGRALRYLGSLITDAFPIAGVCPPDSRDGVPHH